MEDSSDMLAGNEGRTLSIIEKFYFTRNYHEVYSCFFVAGVYRGLTQEALFSALRRVVLRHENFVMTVNGDDMRTAKLVNVENIAFDDVVTSMKRPELAQKKIDATLTDEIIHQIFEYNSGKPLWKIWVINEETVIFICDHIVFDGSSGANFHHLLFEELKKDLIEEKTTGEDQKILFDRRHDTVEHAYISEYDQYSMPNLFSFCQILFEEFGPTWLKRYYMPSSLQNLCGKVYQQKHELTVRDFKFPTGYINVPTKNLERLLQLCKVNKTSLTSLLFYIAAMALSDVTTDNDVKMGFPISIRKRMKQDPRSIGVFVKGGNMAIPAIANPDKLDWDQIHDISRMLQDEVNTDKNLKAIGMLRYINIKDYIFNSGKNPDKVTIEVSNLGAVNIDSSDNIQLHQMFFNQCIGFSGGYFNLNVISTKLGGMSVGYAYFDEDKKELDPAVKKLDLILNNIDNYV